MKVYILVRKEEYDNGDPEFSVNDFSVVGAYSSLDKTREAAKRKILEEVEDRNQVSAFECGFLYDFSPEGHVWHLLKYFYFEQELID